jgi:hypothetical protein
VPCAIAYYDANMGVFFAQRRNLMQRIMDAILNWIRRACEVGRY